MTKIRSAAGGGRAVEVAPERLAGWFARFADRHDGIATTRTTPAQVVVTARDGATAEVTTSFEEFTPTGEVDGLDITSLLAHAAAPRRLGLLLVRLGGHSIGIALDGAVLVSATDSRQVHGRNKAGGWSQQRFARRREGQARVALQAAADDAVRVLVPRLDELDAVVLGGDRQALDALRTDRRLTALFARASTRVLNVPEPRRSVLDDAAERARAVEIIVRDPHMNPQDLPGADDLLAPLPEDPPPQYRP
ncbi:acVLRF1 family peptidyl-tRNA hydrolase [Actinosynnema sp. NPDC023587]|uniref:acVLRF1 family peptidyl-tRNA hydrolase n=1 Tax=Actinosynnema sp. NPDC023587 TaxID=3154695 RepID=UPI0033F1551B